MHTARAADRLGVDERLARDGVGPPTDERDSRSAGRIRACLFDLDGVLTQTAELHAEAWKQTFDAFLGSRTVLQGEPFVPFDPVHDYEQFVDGRPRYDGVRAFLAARAIEVDAATVTALGDRKNVLLRQLIRRRGLEPYEGSVRYLRAVRDAGLRRAVVSASANCRAALEAPGLTELFEVRIDAARAEQEHLRGKPAPDTFLAAARALDVEPAEAAVFEDALAGVTAGRAGGFGFVVGVDRTGHADALRACRSRRRRLRPERAAGEPMSGRPQFAVEPWSVRETHLDLDALARTESMFALANGHIGLRANLDEGEPFGLPGTYLNSFYELRPLPHAESGYGYPESGPDARERHERQDHPSARRRRALRPPLRRAPQPRARARSAAGVLRRTVEWVSPAGAGVRVRSTRLVSFAQRAAAAILYEVEPLDGPVRVVVQSELVANEVAPARSADPRAAAALDSPLQSEEHSSYENRVVLVHSTKLSKLRLAAAMDHLVDGPIDTETWTETAPDVGRVTMAADLAAGQRLRVVKFLAYGASSQRSLPAVRDLAVAALAEARHTGWEGLLESQRAYLDDFWKRADVELDGDTELQQAVRFALFHTLQAGARAEQRAIAAKGLTGPGYDGHTFWDTERFVLPVLTYTVPRAAADALRWRHSTSELARARAVQLGLAGAAFPWRTIRGHECSGYWPAGTAAFHIGADIADAVVRYQDATVGRRLRARGRAWSSSSRRRASGARSDTTTRRARSASTASPARTSTARSPTTTSTRT